MKRTLLFGFLSLSLLITAAVAQQRDGDIIKVGLTPLPKREGQPCRVRYTITNISPHPVYIPRQFELSPGLLHTVALRAEDGRGERVNLKGDIALTPYRCDAGKVPISGTCSSPQGPAELNTELESSWILLEPTQFVGGETELPLPINQYKGALTYKLMYHVDLSWRYERTAKEATKYPVAQGTFLSNGVAVQISSDQCSIPIS